MLMALDRMNGEKDEMVGESPAAHMPFQWKYVPLLTAIAAPAAVW